MIAKDWLTIAGWSFGTFAGLIFLGFGPAYSPGWANGWPFGLSIQFVWSAGMTVLFSLLLMTAAAGAGAVVGAVCAYCGVGLRHGRAIYAGWLVLCCALALFASLWAFREVHASTWELWPNGYNP